MILFLRWIIGIAFFIFGFLSLGTSFISGIFAVLTGALIFPKTSNFLTTKIKLFEQKKWKITAIVLSFLFFLFSSGNTEQEYSMEIKEGQDDPQIVMEFQKDLAELINNYQEAQIRTVVISQIKFGGADLDEAKEYVKETSRKWEEVEKSAEKMGKYIEYQEEKEKKNSNWFDFLKLKEVSAQDNDAEKYKLEVDMESKPGEFTGMENYDNKEVELENKGKNLIQTRWEMVDMIRAMLPDKSILKAVMTEFGTTAKKSKELVDQYHGGMAEVWEDEAKYNHSRENFFRVVGTASSVGLTIGGGVVFMGDLVAITAGPTVISGLKLAAETVVLAFAKTDMVLEVMETGIIVATGDEKNAAAISKTRESTSKVNAVVAIKDLMKSPTLADGGNLSTIYNLSGAVIDTAKAGVEGVASVFLFDQEKDQMKVRVGDKFTPMSSDGIVKEYFPSNFEYEYLGWGDDYQKQKRAELTENQDPIKENTSDLPEDDCKYSNKQLCNPEEYNIHVISTWDDDYLECRKIDGLYRGCQPISRSDVELWKKDGRPIPYQFEN